MTTLAFAGKDIKLHTIGDFKEGLGAQVSPAEKCVVENLKETLKYILVLLNRVRIFNTLTYYFRHTYFMV